MQINTTAMVAVFIRHERFNQCDYDKIKLYDLIFFFNFEYSF